MPTGATSVLVILALPVLPNTGACVLGCSFLESPLAVKDELCFLKLKVETWLEGTPRPPTGTCPLLRRAAGTHPGETAMDLHVSVCFSHVWTQGRRFIMRLLSLLQTRGGPRSSRAARLSRGNDGAAGAVRGLAGCLFP